MKNRVITALFAIFALGSGTGCAILFPGDLLSSFVLDPDVSCRVLTESLRLGTLPDADTPADLGMQFEPFTVTSANGQALDAWFVPAQFDGQLDDTPAGTVLIMHGISGPVACAMPWAVVAANNRMNAVLFDYQGFGESGGSPHIGTLLDDSEAILDWIVADSSPARRSVHLVGVSLGTSPALGLVALRDRPEIRSVALDGSFDPIEIVEPIDAAVGPIFPLFNLSVRLDFPWLFDMRDRLGSIRVPMLFLHAELDRVTPLAGMQQVFDLSGATDKSLWVFQGLTHVQPLFMAEDPYVSLLVTFWRDPEGRPDALAADTDPTIRVPQY